MITYYTTTRDKKVPQVSVGYNHIDHNERTTVNTILDMQKSGVKLTLDEMTAMFNSEER